MVTTRPARRAGGATKFVAWNTSTRPANHSTGGHPRRAHAARNTRAGTRRRPTRTPATAPGAPCSAGPPPHPHPRNGPRRPLLRRPAALAARGGRRDGRARGAAPGEGDQAQLGDLAGEGERLDQPRHVVADARPRSEQGCGVEADPHPPRDLTAGPSTAAGGAGRPWSAGRSPSGGTASPAAGAGTSPSP